MEEAADPIYVHRPLQSSTDQTDHNNTAGNLLEELLYLVGAASAGSVQSTSNSANAPPYLVDPSDHTAPSWRHMVYRTAHADHMNFTWVRVVALPGFGSG